MLMGCFHVNKDFFILGSSSQGLLGQANKMYLPNILWIKNMLAFVSETVILKSEKYITFLKDQQLI